MMMPEYVAITIRIPRQTWETIQRSTLELQGRAREQGMADVVFDAHVHAAMLLEQAVDMQEAQRRRR
jgi:hypothetical protein